MQIALDTNIFVNIFNGQEEADRCYDAIAKALRSYHHCCISASAVTDIFYIVSKRIGSADARVAVNAMLGLARVFDVNEKDVRTALESGIKDFEDAVFVSAAKRNGADLILTYNKKDFKNAGINVMTPAEYLRTN